MGPSLILIGTLRGFSGVEGVEAVENLGGASLSVAVGADGIAWDVRACEMLR